MKKLKVGSKTGLKYFGYEDIQSWEPCYDSIKYISKDRRVTAVDVLNEESVSFADRLWCVVRPEIVSEKTMRLFAVWCYRQTLTFITNPDPRSIEAANVEERFANGQATQEELTTAWAAAWSPARSTAAARAAAARSAGSAAQSASAWASRWAAQKEKLIEMIKAEATERKRRSK